MGKAKEGNNIEYGVYTSDGQQFIPCRLTRAYFTTNAGINTYIDGVSKEIEMDIEEYIKRVYNLEGNTVE